MVANMSLLTGHQKSFIDKFSKLVIRESSDLMNTGSDSEPSDWNKDAMTFTNQITSSKDPTDKRLINLYKLRRAETTHLIEEIKREEIEE